MSYHALTTCSLTCVQCRSVTVCNPNEFSTKLVGHRCHDSLGVQSKAPAGPKCLDPSREKAVHASVRGQRKSTENWVKPWEIVHETIVIDEDTILANYCTKKGKKR